MKPDERREMDIDAELTEIFDGRYKRQEQVIKVLAAVCIALAICVTLISIFGGKRVTSAS